MIEKTKNIECATFGGGCFWCLEAVFQRVRGVDAVFSAYAGGHVINPTYEQVCSGKTGHAEIVEVYFDSEILSYRDLLEIFFVIHDPTTLNSQGNDYGTQYRSIIFTHSVSQEDSARAIVEELNQKRIYQGPVVTEICPCPEIYRAEDYHQNYFSSHPEQGYCRAVIAPKLEKFRSKFKALTISSID